MLQKRIPPIIASGSAVLLSSVILVVTRIKAPFTIFLADRIVPGLGWLQVGVLIAYAVFIALKLSSADDTRVLRLTIWLAFSVVFFLQFIAGVAGIDWMLMTGKLHIPVPAVVIAGPIFRASRFFMPILFISTVVLAGPAWCSYLCYFGPWDNLTACKRPRAKRLGQHWRIIRLIIFVVVPSTALIFRMAGVAANIAGWFAIGFGIVGIGISMSVSLSTGSMAHCTGYCPLGLLANVLGKISPFRIRIAQSCTDCGKCISSCRYGALDISAIQRRRPKMSCTLCGDCLASCEDRSIGYRLGKLNPVYSRALFMGIIAALHACFLGIARI